MALSFGQAAKQYDRIRPSYPAAAIHWALGDPPARVVDLGAGTGIMTRVLIKAGFDPVPVEPDEQMRAQLAAATPGTTALAGSAEAIPLPDASVDAAVAGQAYHWFDRERAHAEVARILRPRGVFSPIWNVRDESVEWVAELTQVAALYDGTTHAAYRIEDFGSLFTAPERAEFRHTTTHTTESLVQLVRSRSYYLTASPTRRKELEAAVRALAGRIGQERFELPYVTIVYRTFRV